jgi:hypothetical protein
MRPVMKMARDSSASRPEGGDLEHGSAETGEWKIGSQASNRGSAAVDGERGGAE